MNLTKKLLCEDLNQMERLYLKSLTMHDGFPVLQKIFDEACRRATEEVMKVNPTDANYEKVLAATQANARAIHEFCQAVRLSFNAHISNAEAMERQEEEKRRENNARN